MIIGLNIGLLNIQINSMYKKLSTTSVFYFAIKEKFFSTWPQPTSWNRDKSIGLIFLRKIMAHVTNVHFSQWRASSMITARDYCISTSVLRLALLQRSDGSYLLSRPTKGSKGRPSSSSLSSSLQYYGNRHNAQWRLNCWTRTRLRRVNDVEWKGINKSDHKQDLV